MNDKFTTSIQILSLFEGTWVGEGRREFPGVTSFNYRETLTLIRPEENSLIYEQKTRSFTTVRQNISHLMRRLVRFASLKTINWNLLAPRRVGAMIRIRFVSRSITNDPRMISSARTFELEGDTLRYEIDMHTTKAERLTPHLKISLQRVK